ncbi:MAG: radical SAM protein [Candidatus Gracilibacteria bacterium]
MANIGYIQVNRYCNNQCHFCSNPSNGNNITYERGMELISNFVDKNYDGIIFTGGEPTLSPNLPKWIQYSTSVHMECRIISNGMMCSNIDYIKRLKDSGLSLIHFSLYSHIQKVHDFLTDTPGSYSKLLQSIQNALRLGIRVQLNCVINKYNQDHLDKTVKCIAKIFPQVQHFVWNNLDPLMMRKTDVALSTLPDFDIVSESLLEAMSFLERNGKTFRVERFPICFMRGFEWASTETRKIVKDEERIVHFLDNRETIRQSGEHWIHDKLEECKECDLSHICSGVYEREKYYNYVKVIPQKVTKLELENIILKIKS